MNIFKIIFGVLVVALLAIVAYGVAFKGSPIDLGQAPSGLSSSAATSTSRSVGTTAVELFPLAASCSSTIIGTEAEPIMVSFGAADVNGINGVASTTLTGSVGFVQAASTTVAYDSGLYGCGPVYVISATGNTSDIEAERHN